LSGPLRREGEKYGGRVGEEKRWGRTAREGKKRWSWKRIEQRRRKTDPETGRHPHYAVGSKKGLVGRRWGRGGEDRTSKSY
jgi:hypothetical protein